MQQINEQVVQGILDIIKEQFHPCRVILFGSYARNQAGTDSDLDLLIVQVTPFDKNHSRIRKAAAIWKALSGFQVPKDILLYSEDEFTRFRTIRNHVVHSAVTEGRILYGTD